MSIEVRVDQDLLAEVVQSKCQMYDHWIHQVATAALSSGCDIVWHLDGLPDELRIQSNVMAALCLSFHGAQTDEWSLAIGDILSLPAGGELAIEEPRLDAVGDHFELLNNAFGTSTPDPEDEDVIEVLSDLLSHQLTSDIWYTYCRKLSDLDEGFCAPLFCVSDGTELRAKIESAVADQIDELMSAFN